MDDLVQFLRGRLDEDERAAQLATGGPWIAEVSGETGHCVIPADAQSTREYVAKTQLLAAVFDAGHIARHDPARVLRDIEAKRALLDLHAKDKDHDGCTICDNGNNSCGCMSGWYWKYPCDTLKILSLPYADRPGYREEWRP